MMRLRIVPFIFLLAISLTPTACRNETRTPEELFTAAQKKQEAGNKEKALALYQEAAQQGHAEAQLALAGYYCCGSLGSLWCSSGGHTCGGRFADKPLAEKWYREAVPAFRKKAYAGDVEAQHTLAQLSYAGAGVDEDWNEARRFWRMAADQQDPRAHLWLGWLSQREENHTEAVTWYQSAAELGHESAYGQLSHLYLMGKGVPQNVVKAVELLHEVIALGNTEAQTHLDRLIHGIRRGASNGFEESKQYLRELEAAGLLPAEAPAEPTS
ncbi:MAG: tetratricopeptide repeat protein [Rhodothermales bacterium]